MKIYISGKISGLVTEEVEAKFNSIAEEIRKRGHEPVNPVEFVIHRDGKTWGEYMVEDCFPMLLNCDAIFMLHDFWLSKEAMLEEKFAEGLGLQKMYRTGDISEVAMSKVEVNVGGKVYINGKRADKDTEFEIMSYLQKEFPNFV